MENAGEAIRNDSLVQNHTAILYETMMETNLLKIISPYSRIELSVIARKMSLSEQVVEKKCSQLILDGKLHGILDQGQGLLIVYDEEATHSTSTDISSSSLRILGNLDQVLDALFHKARATHTIMIGERSLFITVTSTLTILREALRGRLHLSDGLEGGPSHIDVGVHRLP